MRSPPQAWMRVCTCALALGAGACSFDLSKLRGTGEAGVDGADIAPLMDGANDLGTETSEIGPGDDATDVPGDMLVDMGPVDVPPLDTGQDAITVPGTCGSRSTPNVVDVGSAFGGTLVVYGSTQGAQDLMVPPTGIGTCNQDYTTQAAPEMVYRYVVQEGGRLQLTTDNSGGLNCSGIYDTVLYVRSSCDPDAGTVFGCSDDDNVLSECRGIGAVDPSYESGLVVGGLARGQVVFIVVDGFGAAGQFRLAVTENGLPGAAPPDVDAGPGMFPTRCSCPDPSETTFVRLPFPQSGDAPTSLQTVGQSMVGRRTPLLSQVGGIGWEFRIRTNQLGNGPPSCTDNVATFDLTLDGIAVNSFTMDGSVPVNQTVRVSFQLFGPLSLAPGEHEFGLRLRSMAQSGCGGIQFDPAMQGSLTLLGSP